MPDPTDTSDSDEKRRRRKSPLSLRGLPIQDDGQYDEDASTDPNDASIGLGINTIPYAPRLPGYVPPAGTPPPGDTPPPSSTAPGDAASVPSDNGSGAGSSLDPAASAQTNVPRTHHRRPRHDGAPDPSASAPRPSSNVPSAPVGPDLSQLRPPVDNGGQPEAFDVARASSYLARVGSGSHAGGNCLKTVENSLGDLGNYIRQHIRTRHDHGSETHFAGDLIDLMEGKYDRLNPNNPQDNKLAKEFAEITSGRGNRLDPNYKPEIGDIAVWRGDGNVNDANDRNRIGHVEMCVGFRADGTPVWRSDFTSREGNWSGLAHPDSHGDFHIFRQRALINNPNQAYAANSDAQSPLHSLHPHGAPG